MPDESKGCGIRRMSMSDLGVKVQAGLEVNSGINSADHLEVSMRTLLIVFAAGALGALANSLAVWSFGSFGLTAALDVAIAPNLSAHWLYPRIVWGGLWGLLFVLPILPSKLFTKGALLSLFPTAVQLFVVFPLMAHKGMGGLDLGLFTPLFVLFFNWVWGFITALAIKIAK